MYGSQTPGTQKILKSGRPSADRSARSEPMDIGPVSAIRPLTMVKPSPAAPDLSRVFEAEYLGQSKDDEYTPGRKPARGLEDEEEAEPEPEPADALALDRSSGSLNLFA